MAAVTVATGWPRNLVNGHMREWMYKFAIAADADYLDVPLKDIKSAHVNDDALTAMGIASIALNTGGLTSRVTFNSGGALTGCWGRFMGW